MPTNEPYPGTQAVLRAITLLKTFTDEQPDLGLAELARLVELNKTTTYRLLTALESEGMVVRNPAADAYRLGPEAIALGGRAMRANNLRAVSRAQLEALAQQTGETATIELLSAGKALTLDEASGSYLVGATPYVGSHWPLYATSTGKVLLAYLPPDESEALLRFPLVQLTPRTIIKPNAIQRELARIREQGHAVGNQELEIGFVSVAAPVRNHEGQVIAALSVGGPSARLTKERIDEIVGLITPAAARISAGLGYRPNPGDGSNQLSAASPGPGK